MILSWVYREVTCRVYVELQKQGRCGQHLERNMDDIKYVG